MYKIYLITVMMSFLMIGCGTSSMKDKPIANNDRTIVTEGIENEIDILSNDQSNGSEIDKTSITITSQPTSGDIKIDKRSGKIIYRLNDTKQIQDLFKYQVKDKNGIMSNEAIVILDIKKLAYKAKSWYIRIIATNQSSGISTSDSKFGEIEDENTSKYNLKVYKKFDQSELSVVIQDNNDEFKTLFYPYSEEGIKEWNFIIKSSDKSADIVLKWQGVYILDKFIDEYGRVRYKEYRYTKNPLVNYLKLVDKKSGLEIPAIQKGRIYEYRFNMDSENRREFKWVLSDTKIELKTLKSRSLKRDIKMMSDTQKVFDLKSPPYMDRIHDEQDIRE